MDCVVGVATTLVVGGLITVGGLVTVAMQVITVITAISRLNSTANKPFRFSRDLNKLNIRLFKMIQKMKNRSVYATAWYQSMDCSLTCVIPAILWK